MAAPPSELLQRFLSWLRQGYPHGLPRGDYVALLGVLRRRLTEAEIESVAEQLAADDENVTADDIRALIREQSLLDPKKKDVRQVAEAIAEINEAEQEAEQEAAPAEDASEPSSETSLD